MKRVVCRIVIFWPGACTGRLNIYFSNRLPQETNMKTRNSFLFMLLAMALIATSCTRYITTYEAANGKAKCGRALR